MQGTHTLTFRLKDGKNLAVVWAGGDTDRVLNWWVTGDDRVVDTAVHTFTPAPSTPTSSP